jgi:hypothetical protein
MVNLQFNQKYWSGDRSAQRNLRERDEKEGVQQLDFFSPRIRTWNSWRV